MLLQKTRITKNFTETNQTHSQYITLHSLPIHNLKVNMHLNPKPNSSKVYLETEQFNGYTGFHHEIIMWPASLVNAVSTQVNFQLKKVTKFNQIRKNKVAPILILQLKLLVIQRTFRSCHYDKFNPENKYLAFYSLIKNFHFFFINKKNSLWYLNVRVRPF